MSRLGNVGKQEGRIVFIDPNDLASLEGFKFGSQNDRDNFYYNNEDLGISVDLQVFIPDRDRCLQNADDFNSRIAKLNINWGKSLFASMFQGNMEQAKSKTNYLTTDYTDITYAEIAAQGVSSRESLGVESIDITFNENFYPQVTIKFVDVRGYSLMMPAEKEASGAEGYTNFFKSLFHFPYPRFMLSVKGHFGNRVTFQLAVNEFKTALNANTGNFDVTITFIGYMFGLYTELPMNLLIVAPYIDGSVNKDALSDNWTTSPYWTTGQADGRYTFMDGNPIPTFMDFMDKYTSIARTIQDNMTGMKTDALNSMTLGEDQIKMLEDIKTKINTFLDNPANVIKSDVEVAKGQSTNYYFTNSKSVEKNATSKSNWDAVKKAIDDAISTLSTQSSTTSSTSTSGTTSGTTESTSGTTTTDSSSQATANNDALITFLKNLYDFSKCPIKGSSSIDKFNTTELKAVVVEEKDGKYILNASAGEISDSVAKDAIVQNPKKFEKKKYYFEINHGNIISKIDSKINSTSSGVEQMTGEAEEEAEQMLETALGFKLTIENVYRMLFAHIDVFMKYMYGVIKEVRASNRKVGDVGINARMTDLSKFATSHSFLPPFFALYERQKDGEQKNELKYPGVEQSMATIPEVMFVNKLTNATLAVRIAMNSINKKIAEYASMGGQVSGDTTEIKYAFAPMNVGDIYSNGKNPYQQFVDKKTSGNDAYGEMLYFAKCRIRTDSVLNYAVVSNNAGKREAANCYVATKKKGLDWNIESNWKQLLSEFEKDSGLIDSKCKDNPEKLLSDSCPIFFTNAKINNDTKWLDNKKDCFRLYETDEVPKSFAAGVDFTDDEKFSEAMGEHASIFKSKCVFVDEMEWSLWESSPHQSRLYKIKNDDDFKNVSFSSGSIYKDLEGFDSYKSMMQAAFKESNYDDYRVPFVGKNQQFFAEEHKGNKYDTALNFLIWLLYAETETCKRKDRVSSFFYNKVTVFPKGVALFLGGLGYEAQNKITGGSGYNATRDYLRDNLEMFQPLVDFFKRWVDTSWDSLWNSLEFNKNKSKYVNIKCKDGEKWLIKAGEDKELVKLILDKVYFATMCKDRTHSVKQSEVDEQLGIFVKSMKEMLASGSTESSDTNGTATTNTDATASTEQITGDKISKDVKLATYYSLKMLYDKWLCSYDEKRFQLQTPAVDREERRKHTEKGKYKFNNAGSEYSSFIYVDSLYNDISTKMLLNPSMLYSVLERHIDVECNWSCYQFMAEVAQENNLLFIALPVYNNFYNIDGLIDMFTPHSLYDGSSTDMLGLGTTYMLMYTHEVSHCLDMKDDSTQYDNDGFDIADYKGNMSPEAVNLFAMNNSGDDDIFYVPAFAVSYAKQNQQMFKSISVNMDNARETDYSIANTFKMAKIEANGCVIEPTIAGQDLFSVYSNRSYNCTVEMMGCVNIMPMMYFQLNNIPMFKGTYMVTSIQHHIQNNDMTTRFSGVRVSKNSIPYTKNMFNLKAFKNLIKTYNVNRIGNNCGQNYLGSDGSSGTQFSQPFTGNGALIMNSAKIIADWMLSSEGFSGKYTHGSKLCSITNTQVRGDCSGYVSAVLYHAGVTSVNQERSIEYKPESGAGKAMVDAGFKVLEWPGYEGLQPGDVVRVQGHVYIWAGNNQRWDFGNNRTHLPMNNWHDKRDSGSGVYVYRRP